MFGKNIENELRAVDNAAFRDLFDVALLHRGKIAVENNQGSLMSRGFSADFVELAAPDQGRGIGGVAHLKHRAGYVSAGAACEFDEFCERFAALFTRESSGNSSRECVCGHRADREFMGGRRGHAEELPPPADYTLVASAPRLSLKPCSPSHLKACDCTCGSSPNPSSQ